MKNYLMARTSTALALALAACTDMNGGQVGNGTMNVPVSVAAMAAPNQDLTTARVLPEDGCYWYVHTNPVETTLLPLRNKEGRPICTR